MKFFTYMGASACISLYFFTGKNIEFGIISAIIASMGFSGALVFYVSYLPDIATEDKYDMVSARGFSYGFIGSVIHLIISLVLISYYQSLGLKDASAAARLSFLIVGLWWIGFAQIAFYYLPKPEPRHAGEAGLFKKGFQELNKVWQSLKDLPNTKIFLLAFFFYSMGAQTMLLLATIFGSKVLKLNQSQLIMTTLLIQMVGIMGAYGFAYLSEKKGNKFALIVMVIVWTAICVTGYFIHTPTEFYILAAAVGVVMGAIHLSRSTYAKLIPENTPDTTSYFSFYDVTEKLAIVTGTFTFGFVSAILDMRSSIIALSLYFFIGLIILWKVKIPRQKF